MKTKMVPFTKYGARLSTGFWKTNIADFSEQEAFVKRFIINLHFA